MSTGVVCDRVRDDVYAVRYLSVRGGDHHVSEASSMDLAPVFRHSGVFRRMQADSATSFMLTTKTPEVAAAAALHVSASFTQQILTRVFSKEYLQVRARDRG
jgi:hypothetical protein